MNKEIRKIGVLTSGGDAPGMNAAIRAIVRTACYHNLEVMGVVRGYNGLINGELIPMNARSVSETLQKGGTILQTARCREFKEAAGVQRAYDTAKTYGLDGLIVIGGDGSFRGARDLTRIGLPTIAMPGTIDNDIGCSEYTVGYDTCLNTVIEAVDKIRDTSSSHERCSVIEVMGRDAGYIAINAGIACGAEVVLVPEKEYKFDADVLRVVLEGKTRGRKHSIIIVAEGVKGMSVLEMAKEIENKTGIETRATILGHIQRGGSPSARDRVNASLMGSKCVELLLEGKSNRVVVMKDGQIVDIDIEEGLKMKKAIPEEMFEIAKKLST
ncbi:MAG: 6-phosphofructokinase [Clostridia bacterium]|nr:6-phosphofructokinase [Clostridia bacterium]